jgi:hypothetical protein
VNPGQTWPEHLNSDFAAAAVRLTIWPFTRLAAIAMGRLELMCSLCMCSQQPHGCYAVALLPRTTGLTSRLAQELPVARAYACDVTDPAAVERTFASVALVSGADQFEKHARFRLHT